MNNSFHLIGDQLIDDLYQHKNKFIEFAQKVSIPASEVAKLIHETIVKSKPYEKNNFIYAHIA